MKAERFLDALENLGAGFFTGVPDSLLSPFCDLVVRRYPENHVVAANEGAAAGLAAGHYLASGAPAVVYMQNSGVGNAVNPVCSLLHEKVYGIPVIFVVGWRGEPGVKDEPQHVYQGQATLSMLDVLEIPYEIVSPDTDDAALGRAAARFRPLLGQGRQVAFVIRKGALTGEKNVYRNENTLSREEVLEAVVKKGGARDAFICTTGKLSREMFELREKYALGHGRDFLTVGSMGHSLMIALGVALGQPDRRVWCLDGDGAAIMHLGSLAVAGVRHPRNLLHLIVNNGAHETVGGIPTAGAALDFSQIALACGYAHAHRAASAAELLDVLDAAVRQEGPVLVEALCDLRARADLGRPTSTPAQNRDALMEFLGSKQ